jgi:hypothetical protein
LLPSNTIFWHGSIELNTMTFVFFTFTINARSTQNCCNVFNCCYNPTFDSNIKTRSFTKNNNHTCKFAKVDASHSLSSKRPSKASKYSPNSRGLIYSFVSHLAGT